MYFIRHLLADPTAEEEKLGEGTEGTEGGEGGVGVEVVVGAQSGTLFSLRKIGGSRLETPHLQSCISLAQQRSQKLKNLIDQALQKAEQLKQLQQRQQEESSSVKR